jgi:hypothetical protein
MIDETDLAKRVGIATPTDDETAQLARVLGGVRSKIAKHYALPDTPTDDELAAWDEAHLIAAHRLWRRKDTPEGRKVFADGTVIRVTGLDGDVEELLEGFVIWGMA